MRYDVVKIHIPAPSAPCNVRDSGGTVVGKASSMYEFKTLARSLTSEPMEFEVLNGTYTASSTDDTDRTIYRCSFTDLA